MRNKHLYLILFVLYLFLGSCSFSKHITSKGNIASVSVGDFNYLDEHAYRKNKALMLNESVYVSQVGLSELPQNSNETIKHFSSGSAWKTEIEDKILFLKDSINDEAFSMIYYVNPRDVQWELMRKCKMWLYSLKENGNISKRKIRKEELVCERLNEYICRVRLNIKENVSGKILVREYSLLSPYGQAYGGIIATIHTHDRDVFADLKAWTFQKDIPLLHGKFKIDLPEGKGEVVATGKGKVDIKRKKSEENISYRHTTTEPTLSGRWTYERQDAGSYSRRIDQIDITVSNVLPLPEESNEEPLGFRIVVPKTQKEK